MSSSHQIDAPISLISFFPDSSESDQSDGEGSNDQAEVSYNDPCYESQTIEICGQNIVVRQYSFHSHNANQVWPGTFNLAEYLLVTQPDGSFTYNWGSVLELGTATGLLSMRLALDCSFSEDIKQYSRRIYACTDIVTSDVEDEFGEIVKNLQHNYTVNNFISADIQCSDVVSLTKRRIRPVHIPHTWGSGWIQSVSKQGFHVKKFNTIIGSDILLYVNSYPALVCTLQEIFEDSCETNAQFIMSWKRRMKHSEIFFNMMKEAGFTCCAEKNCIFRFTKDRM